MFDLSKFILKASLSFTLLGLAGCAGEIIEEGFYDPDSRAAEAWRDEHTGGGEEPGA
ncbi:hypothetical protein [Bathymodiolus japonicus methanotrophic gill symbiont]|uniref:hypothetical protein n=1 Tax=Bathymodiolus japonicus methanotrophic gill symbiont TaxID=113269 RepID=UPI001C8E105B|nr:hypothetical protein [Bathymodiolus japonicus methanotrophic gill symbiont]